MSAKATPGGASASSRWVRITTLGWLLGFLLVIVLAMAWDQIGGGAQFMVGVGMGAGVSMAQARVVRDWGVRSGLWILVTTAGMGLPFLLWDLAAGIGRDSWFTLPRCVVVGSLLVGILQARLLRASHRHTLRWPPANLVGWGLPVAAVALADSGFLSGTGALLSPVAMIAGGAILGAVTGRVLASMPRRSTG